MITYQVPNTEVLPQKGKPFPGYPSSSNMKHAE
jgi:hypothetical protein